MTLPTTKETIAHLDLARLPNGSLLRLYDPVTQGNSFSLDGFPAVQAGQDWLARLIEIIETQGAMGMTTNQTLFRQLTEAGVLDERLRALKAQGRSAGQIYWILYNEAATQAARAFGEIHARWPWEGRVSQEASAFLTEIDPLVKDVQRIAKAMAGVGAFTKVPNLKVGPQALRKAIGHIIETEKIGTFLEGTVPIQVHPNVTLVFSDRHYLNTVEGYLLGVEDRVKAMQAVEATTDEIRKDLGRIHSVNSLFVSRVDRVVDPMIDEAMKVASDEGTRQRLRLLKGKVAVAQAKKVYQIFEAIFLGMSFPDPEGLYSDEGGRAMVATMERLHRLYTTVKSLGANPQRLLIASSGVKSEQPYSALLYVLPFLGPWVANTLPEGTLKAFSQFVAGLSDTEVATLRARNLMKEPLPALLTDQKARWDQTLLARPEERRTAGSGEVTADKVLEEIQKLVLAPSGTSLRAICDTLRDKGAASFTADEQATLQAIETKLNELPGRP